jgi:Tfp pilus assembly protein PilF
MIKHDSSYAGGYFALALVAEHAGDVAGARRQFDTAEKLWSKADKDLPELRRIHQGVAANR